MPEGDGFSDEVEELSETPARQARPEALDSEAVVGYYRRLRTEQRIDYAELAETARGLATLSEEMRKSAITFFTKTDSQSDGSSD
ncbi:unnamed protein product [Sphagnum balticum]